MSYDLHIWSVRPFQPDMLKNRERWHSNEGSASYLLPGGQIVINPSDSVLADDVPDEISTLLPGISFLTEINLEGTDSTKALQLLRSTAKDIAKGAHGVIEDQQDDSITTPAGIKRFVPPKKEQKFSTLDLSWWFLTDVLATAPGRESFLSLLEKRLPEALPKRYGLYEPPQHKFETAGKEHLQTFIAENLHDTIVWYPHRPVSHFNLACPDPLGAGPQGFRTNLLEIQVESAVLAQPGWRQNLEVLWRQMTFLLRPIYSEIRTTPNHVRMGATVGMMAADLVRGYPSTTRGWFWRGIPRQLGHAAALGPEYQGLWPAFLPHAQIDNGFAFSSTPDWSSDLDLADHIGGVPRDIALHPGEGFGPKQKYPATWPFGSIFNPPPQSWAKSILNTFLPGQN